MGDQLRLIVLGAMGRHPLGGQTWLHLNWLSGLARLGHEVHYVEDQASWPYDPVRLTRTADCTYARGHISRCMERIGLADRWSLRVTGLEGACWGRSEGELDALYRSCDALLNVSATELGEAQLAAPFRVYIQTDPVVSELQLANGDEYTRQAFAAHDAIVSYGENFGAPDCGVPLNGIRYGKTRQPVDLELWPYAHEPRSRFFTTIGNYRQDGWDVEHEGEVYSWSKHHEWERFIDLPSHTEQPFELAMMPTDEADRLRLGEHGWRLVDPFEMSLDVFGAYPAFIRGSRAEFTVAKAQNIRLRSGWFSERGACYLASGKPVVAQDTGFGNILPTGEGLFGFTTADEALSAIEEINADYERHCKAARAIAEEFFEAGAVAARLLDEVGLG
jgi:hypothetical protein